ncbi:MULTISPECIES: hypothetical protein [unclassified Bradyrhizobium]|uniref:hypothetical protein n=1 Tax=unclassified Bradyrhizobium TaxID=2631580 RepID=UPI00211E8FBB|nr:MULTISPECIES: hypothetical protein [unclassified Bradyrhizobium]MDD1534604.1 hypothetical protein [Bradyrhizobium sp. WBOS8]MDD1581468.1 hypothetical protein [Bradyrhizobium sp. WBOS4]UUO49754.1 hypothetical protein DCM78_24280 [Bradyrhizobium sp. WBOS04]UUO58520.1 hypothetical protein DCM80_04560 [Bradyrhizobium sp. WBOS08]
MKNWDQGLGAIGLIVLAAALTALISIGVPISVSKDTVELKDWLGFAGNILGAFGTLMAAFIAWNAVQQQIRVARAAQLLEVTAREEDRIETELLAIGIIKEKADPVAGTLRLVLRDRYGLLADELEEYELSENRHQMATNLRSKLATPFPIDLLQKWSLYFSKLCSISIDLAIIRQQEEAGEPYSKELDQIHRDNLRRWRAAFDRQLEDLIAHEYRLRDKLKMYRKRIELGLSDGHN